MPLLRFLAAREELPSLVEAVFRVEAFRVFEAFSAPEEPLRRFESPGEIPLPAKGVHLALHPVDAGPEPLIRRIELRGPSARVRWSCEGWGLVFLHLVPSATGGGRLLAGTVNHNSERRALRWAPHYPEYGDPASWDWRAVTRASRRLNGAIERLSAHRDARGAVLPAAAAILAGTPRPG